MSRRLKLLILWMAKLLGLFALAQLRTRGQLRILCYHGLQLDDETAFRPKLFIEGSAFAERLGRLARRGATVLPLQQATRALYNRERLPNLPVVITFDDGWYSTYRVALPLLQTRGYPVTVYVTSYYVNKCRPIFRLAIQYMFWKSRAGKLDLSGLLPDGQPTDLTQARERDQAMWACIDHGEQLGSQDERDTLAATVGQLLEVPYAALCDSRIMSLMTPQEVAQSGAQGVDIQLHTHRHTFAPRDRSAARREIEDNAAALAPLVRRDLDHFCYPSGIWHPDCFEVLSELGIASATTCEPGFNTAATPRYMLCRFLDGSNIAPLEFEAELSGFLQLMRVLRRQLPQLPARQPAPVPAKV